jgi:hypothetical protein
MKQQITCIWSVLYTHIVLDRQVDTHSSVTVVVVFPHLSKLSELGFM